MILACTLSHGNGFYVKNTLRNLKKKHLEEPQVKNT